MSNSNIGWFSDEKLPSLAPPSNSVGPVAWVRNNLFSSPLNAILTLASIYFLYVLIPPIVNWSWVYSMWSTDGAQACRDIVKESGHHGACWSVVVVRFEQLIYGFYPNELKWRPNLAFLGMLVAIAPILFDLEKSTRAIFSAVVLLFAILFTWLTGINLIMWGVTVLLLALCWLPKPKMLIFSSIYPVMVYWLLWGGSVWGIALFFASVLLAYMLYKIVSAVLRAVLGNGPGNLISLISAGLFLFLSWAYVIDPLSGEMIEVLGFVGLESVGSAKLGGFLLTVLIGVTGILGSLPLGILLALGRQSDMLFIKAVCVGFIEMIRGVPLITLLFVASTLLNYFLPPGTNFDIILRVIIMVTLFASAYMAEVIRGGLAALPKGQYEAADALGLDYNKAMRLIVMPQALKISIPGIVNTFIGLFKDTTLVSIIGLLDPLGLVQSIQSDINWSGTAEELYVFIAVVFFIFCFSMSRYSMHLERKLQTGHR